MLKAFFKLQQMGPQRCPFLQLQTSDLLLNNRLLTGRLPGEHFFENLSFDFSPWKHSRYSSAKNFFFFVIRPGILGILSRVSSGDFVRNSIWCFSFPSRIISKDSTGNSILEFQRNPSVAPPRIPSEIFAPEIPPGNCSEDSPRNSLSARNTLYRFRQAFLLEISLWGFPQEFPLCQKFLGIPPGLPSNDSCKSSL